MQHDILRSGLRLPISSKVWRHSVKGQNRPLSICFIGVDGSGKTTCAINLCKELVSKGFDCRYVHQTYTLINCTPSIVRASIGKKILPLNEPNVGTYKALPNRGVTLKITITLWLFVALIDSLAGYLIKIRPLIRKSMVISDRYFYQHIISNLNASPKWLVKCYLSLIPKPDLIFLLDVPARIAYCRSKEFPLNFYKQQRKQYLNLVKQLDIKNVLVIDTSTDVMKTNSLILDHTVNLLKTRGKYVSEEVSLFAFQ